MLNLKQHLMIGLAIVGSVIAIMPSFAQIPQADAQDPGMRPQYVPSAEQRAKFEQMRAKHQAVLHDKLKLSSAQEGAWKTFIDKTTALRAVPPSPRLGKDDWYKLSAPEQMERRLGLMQQRQAHMVEQLNATKEFYAVLSPQQQKLFDQSLHKMEEHRFQAGRGRNARSAE